MSSHSDGTGRLIISPEALNATIALNPHADCEQRVATAVKAERKACEEIVREFSCGDDLFGDIADAIATRGKANEQD